MLSVAMVALTLGGHIVHSAEQPPFSLSASTAHASMRVGSVVTVRIVFKNGSDQEIRLPLIAQEPIPYGYRVEAVDENGGRVPYTKFGARWAQEGISGGVCEVSIPVKAGEEIAAEVDLNKIFDFGRPGRYKVQVLHIDPVTKLNVKSNNVDIAITK
jgi:hypothetical protein